MGITPLVFTGISKFSDDLQTILTRAVSIASLPVRQMQTDQANLLSKKQLLTNLQGVVQDLATKITSLGTIGQNQAIAASSSNANRVSVTLNGATLPASYTISEITSVATAASENTLTGYATDDQTQVATTGTVELVVGTETHEITLGAGENNLQGLRDAINALGAGVSAAILNTGTGATPYYLSITAASTGVTTLQLLDTPGNPASNLVTATNQGADAVFKLNGLPVTKSGNVITDVVPGLAMTIVSTTTGAETVTVSLSSNRGELATALSSLVSSYNSVQSQVQAQVGKTAGLLSGDFIIREAQSSLRALTTYRGTGTIKSLMDLGIEFDNTGTMSFSQTKFYSLSDSDITSAFSFLGSPTTGFGALSAKFTQISDPITGQIKAQSDQYDLADARLSTQIEDLSARIGLMQSTLSAKLQQADALLAKLESQQTLLDASIESLNLALYGRKNS